MSPAATTKKSAGSRPQSPVSAPAVSLKAPPRPDQNGHEEKNQALTKQIDDLKEQVTKIRAEIAGNSNNNKGGEGEEKKSPRQELLDKIQAVKEEFGKHREARNKIFELMKASQESLKKKIDEVRSAKDRIPFKSVEDIDRKVSELEGLVSSGQLTLMEEKKALAEVSSLRKQRRQFDQFAPMEAAIEVERNKADAMRKKLDEFEPEGKRFKKTLDELHAQLREFNAKKDETMGKMKSLFSERDRLSKQLDELFQERRQLNNAFKKEKDAWFQWQREDRARKAEIARQQRAEFDKQKKLEAVQRAKELAELPAFELELSQCHSLIVMLRQMSEGGVAAPSAVAGTSVVDVKSNLPAARSASEATNLPKGVSGATVLRKKSDRMEEESFFQVSSSSKKKGSPNKQAAAPAKGALKFDLSVVEQFLALKVDMITKHEEIPKAIEALEKKKQYFLENQERATKENVAKAQALEAKLLKSLETPEDKEKADEMEVVESASAKETVDEDEEKAAEEPVKVAVASEETSAVEVEAA